MSADLWSLYALMLKSRMFEQVVTQLWHDGLISGEMHMNSGEEAVIAGVVSQLEEGDAMAVDHRSTAPFLMRGVDAVAMLREFLGREDGLCKGLGGHMHLYSKAHLAASSGIVGASGPAAVGFALAGRVLRPGSIAVAFFGEGALNQGMLMESMNLAAEWNLPVLFVCKDDNWAITTTSSAGSSARIRQRAEGLGLEYHFADGLDVAAVWEVVQGVMPGLRVGSGPVFLHARCIHLEKHFLGFQLLRLVRNPLKEIPPVALPLIRSLLQLRGAPLKERFAGLKIVLSSILDTLQETRKSVNDDPLVRTRTRLSQEAEKLVALEDAVQGEIESLLQAALTEEKR